MSASEAAKKLRPFLATLLDREFVPVPSLDEGPSSDPGIPAALWDSALLGPLSDFLERSGKEFRARLVERSWVLGGGKPGAHPEALPYLVEMLHAGSLVVDDIEDESEMRRGVPALHRRWGTPVALNAGNWLYFWPMHLLSRMGLSDAATLATYRHASAALLRCHQGQALDLVTRIFELPQQDVPSVVSTITRLKTGSLMELAAAMGAIAAGARAPRVRALSDFGRELGNALQMLDDLGGLTTEHRLEKGEEDLRHGRATWPWAWMSERLDAISFHHRQREARAVFEGKAPLALRDLVRADVSELGRRRVREHLDGAFRRLRTSIGTSATLDDLQGEIRRLERSY